MKEWKRRKREDLRGGKEDSKADSRKWRNGREGRGGDEIEKKRNILKMKKWRRRKRKS